MVAFIYSDQLKGMENILQLWRLGGNEHEQDRCSKSIVKGIQLSNLSKFTQSAAWNNLCAGHADHCTVSYCISSIYSTIICVQFHLNPLRTDRYFPEPLYFPCISQVFPWCHPPWWRLLEAGPRARGGWVVEGGLIYDIYGSSVTVFFSKGGNELEVKET